MTHSLQVYIKCPKLFFNLRLVYNRNVPFLSAVKDNFYEQVAVAWQVAHLPYIIAIVAQSQRQRCQKDFTKRFVYRWKLQATFQTFLKETCVLYSKLLYRYKRAKNSRITVLNIRKLYLHFVYFKLSVYMMRAQHLESHVTAAMFKAEH